MSLRRDVHTAFDQITPSIEGLPERVLQTVRDEGATRRRKERMLFRVRAPLSLVAVFLLIALVAALFVGGRLIHDWNAFNKPVPGGQSYESEVAQLEARPLQISYPKSQQDCVSGPYHVGGVFGSGPVYAEGGFPGGSSWGFYYHNLAYADADIKGPILVRAVDLFTKRPVVFIGQYAAGPVAGTDAVGGTTYEQHSELLFDTSNASKTNPARKFIWQFTAGVPNSWSGSTGWQIDGIGFSEVFYAC